MKLNAPMWFCNPARFLVTWLIMSLPNRARDNLNATCITSSELRRRMFCVVRTNCSLTLPQSIATESPYLCLFHPSRLQRLLQVAGFKLNHTPLVFRLCLRLQALFSSIWYTPQSLYSRSVQRTMFLHQKCRLRCQHRTS